MSQNKNILKSKLTSAGATFLAACGRALGIPVISSPTLALIANKR